MSAEVHGGGALRGTHMGGANFQFKQKYLRTLEIMLLVAIALHVIVMYSVPPIEIQPYTLEEEVLEAVEVPDEIVIPPPPEEIERPALPAELSISDEVSLEETIPDTDFNPFAPPAVPEDTGNQSSFYAFDSPPKPIKTSAPKYPELARAAGAEGTVLVEITVDEKGRVIGARVLQSNTIKSLENAAVAAAKEWLFTPAKQRDKPVKAKIAIPFDFSLSSN